MSSNLLSRGAQTSRPRFFLVSRLHLPFCPTRAASLNSGINRGLRKSQGVGFKGKESSSSSSPFKSPIKSTRSFDRDIDEVRESRMLSGDERKPRFDIKSKYTDGRDGGSRGPSSDGRKFSNDRYGGKEKGETRGFGRGIVTPFSERGEKPGFGADRTSFQKSYERSPSSRFGDEKKPYEGSSSRFDKPGFGGSSYKSNKPPYKSRDGDRFDKPGFGGSSYKSDKPPYKSRDGDSYDKPGFEATPYKKNKLPYKSRVGDKFDKPRFEATPYNSDKPPYKSKDGDRYTSDKPSYGSRSGDRYTSSKPSSSYDSKSDSKYAENKYPSLSKTSYGGGGYNAEKPSYESRGSDRYASGKPSSPYDSKSTKYDSKYAENKDLSQSTEPPGDDRPAKKFEPTIHKYVPISIPYTTPASEFLYGTSVVEAALNSRRDPRRKLYKIYIYYGPTRELNIDLGDRDAGMRKLAKKNGVEIVKVNGEHWLRTMDKMSKGRPHNGYILEASPLPKLPVTSLGGVVHEETSSNFKVVLDHQSREEAAVNGTSDVVSIPRDGSLRKPLVLLLDSIEDPGNLGAIIRTASFMGVAAVAISTRNTASFTPVVLKASAGASENMTLFSVANTAGFITESKLAGWKVYAAVAPPEKKSKGLHIVYTDDLKNPLSEDPCILMLGGEGEGLRKTLRNKADVELSIRGLGQNKRLDSLNVSVATGILCNSFMRQPPKQNTAPAVEKAVEEAVQEAVEEFENEMDDEVENEVDKEEAAAAAVAEEVAEAVAAVEAEAEALPENRIF